MTSKIALPAKLIAEVPVVIFLLGGDELPCLVAFLRALTLADSDPKSPVSTCV